MKSFLIIGLLAFSASVARAQTIPAGTLLPVRLNTSLSSSKCHPGQRITARLMQSVPLPDGGAIRAGSKLEGHVVRVDTSANNGRGEIAFQFDTLKASGSSVPLKADLRAMASFMEINDARIPDMGADRGTSEAAYTTVQVGGEVVYRGGGPVMDGSDVVGHPVPDGVLAQPRPNPEAGCRGVLDGNDRPQAMWVFASNACGAYGMPLLTITSAGRSNLLGEIVLTARDGELHVPSGTGMLLRVVHSGA